jgi:hypothetical protein
MFTACVCIGDCLIFKHNEKEITVYGFLLFLESIPLPKACASHIENFF